MSLLNLLPDPCNRAINDDGEAVRDITLTERLAGIDGVEVRGVSYAKTTDNARITYNARDNEIWLASDTFIGDSCTTTLPLSDDTIVELFSKW